MLAEQLTIQDAVIKQELKKDVIVKIQRDNDPFNPREDDNLGTMVCFHSRYNLGDDYHGLKSSDFDSWSDLSKYLIKECNAKVILPLYLYDHSGITMSCGRFNDAWDSGQVGFIYITTDKIKKEYSVKRISKQLIAKIKSYLVSEVEEYNNYLTGECYRYTIEDKATGEELDSCSGFLGYDYTHKWEDMLDNSYVKSAYKSYEIQEEF